jgi:hypothetical protein
MSRATFLSVAFLIAAVALSAWVLLRGPRAATMDAVSADSSSLPSHAGWTFAEWSTRSDGVLLTDIDPGQGTSSVPRRFQVERVKVDEQGAAVVTDGPSFAWALESRQASASGLADLGFRVSAVGRAYVPPDDPLWSLPLHTSDAATDETVSLKSKGGITAMFVRHRGDPSAEPYWGRRAIGFASGDGRLVYVTPDAIVIRAMR